MLLQKLQLQLQLQKDKTLQKFEYVIIKLHLI